MVRIIYKRGLAVCRGISPHWLICGINYRSFITKLASVSIKKSINSSTTVDQLLTISDTPEKPQAANCRHAYKLPIVQSYLINCRHSGAQSGVTDSNSIHVRYHWLKFIFCILWRRYSVRTGGGWLRSVRRCIVCLIIYIKAWISSGRLLSFSNIPRILSILI